MKSPINVLWTEGMLLTQQHFQQFQYYVDYYENWLFRSNTAFSYGVFNLRIHEEALLNGVFQLSQCQGFFKTGERIDVRQPIQLSLEKPGAVFLCLTETSSISNLEGYPCEIRQSRYLAYSQDTQDEYDPYRKQAVYVKQENYFLTQDPSYLDKTAYIKLADLEKNTLNGFHLSDAFMPACLNLFCLHQFESYFYKLVDYLQSILFLFDNSYYKIDSQLPYFLKQFLASLQSAFFQKQYHPWRFYQDFYYFVMAISSIFPISYDHEQLSSVLEYVDKKIRVLLPSLAPKRVMMISLHAQTDCLFLSANLADVLSQNVALYLYISFSLSDSRLGLFCQQVKVTAASDIDLTINSALPGIQLSITDPPPKEFKQQGCYLLLNPIGKCWQKIMEEKQLAVFLTNDFLGTEIKLMAREI